MQITRRAAVAGLSVAMGSASRLALATIANCHYPSNLRRNQASDALPPLRPNWSKCRRLSELTSSRGVAPQSLTRERKVTDL
jgi:hypothetical protein